MMIALDGIIECVHAEVEHAVVRICVLMDDFIYRTWLIMGCEVLRSHEMALVEVSLADAYKVDPYEEYDGNGYDHGPAIQDE